MYNLENWKEIYYNKKIINLAKNLNDNEIVILNKLGILIEDKVYTEYEYDMVKQKISFYFDDEEDLNGKLKLNEKMLKNKNVTINEFNNILNKLDSLDLKYNIYT